MKRRGSLCKCDVNRTYGSFPGADHAERGTSAWIGCWIVADPSPTHGRQQPEVPGRIKTASEGLTDQPELFRSRSENYSSRSPNLQVEAFMLVLPKRRKSIPDSDSPDRRIGRQSCRIAERRSYRHRLGGRICCRHRRKWNGLASVDLQCRYGTQPEAQDREHLGRWSQRGCRRRRQ
jgi:hypothetical protein